MGKIALLLEATISGLADSLEIRNKQRGQTQNLSIDTAGPISSNSFGNYLRQKKNIRLLLIGSIGLLLQFVLFKLLYPFPDFISDSYSYIETNLYKMDVNLWPIGYSKYIWLIHLITPSDTFLIFTQFLILEASLFYFYFSVTYLYPLSERYSNILLVFLFLNPIFLYLSNCVLSDALFLALSLAFLTQLLWMMRSPKPHHLLTQALLIGIAFYFRYTAIYYPFIASAAFLLSKQSTLKKAVGVLLPWLLILPFIFYTKQKTKEITGTAQFSVFGGWQIANNALYMYDHINVDSSKLPAGTVELDKLARSYFADVAPERRQLEPLPGTFFIKKQNAILKPYMFQRYKIEDAPGQFLAWGKVSPVYEKYGWWLIKNYPLPFLKYYIWLNTKNYFIPHLEKFSNYNLGLDSVNFQAQEWFRYKTAAVPSLPASEFQNHIFFFYPPLFMMLNVYFAISFTLLAFGRKRKIVSPLLMRSFWLISILLIANFAFSVFATPVVLRYQIFPMILLTCFSLYLTDVMDKQKKTAVI